MNAKKTDVKSQDGEFGEHDCPEVNSVNGDLNLVVEVVSAPPYHLRSIFDKSAYRCGFQSFSEWIVPCMAPCAIVVDHYDCHLVGSYLHIFVES